MALKSTSQITNNVLTFTCTDTESGDAFTKTVDLSIFGSGFSPLALSAISMAVKTAIRNATGGKDLAEAEEAVDARLAAWAAGEWGAERGGSTSESLPIAASNVLAKAVARVYAEKFASDAKAAAEALSAMLEKSLADAGHPDFDSLDEESQRKARNAFTKMIREKDRAVDGAIAVIQAEQAAKRAEKKAGVTAPAGLF